MTDDLDEGTQERLQQQAEIRKLRGQLYWQGDLDAMRKDNTTSTGEDACRTAGPSHDN